MREGGDERLLLARFQQGGVALALKLSHALAVFAALGRSERVGSVGDGGIDGTVDDVHGIHGAQFRHQQIEEDAAHQLVFDDHLAQRITLEEEALPPMVGAEAGFAGLFLPVRAALQGRRQVIDKIRQGVE